MGTYAQERIEIIVFNTMPTMDKDGGQFENRFGRCRACFMDLGLGLGWWFLACSRDLMFQGHYGHSRSKTFKGSGCTGCGITWLED